MPELAVEMSVAEAVALLRSRGYSVRKGGSGGPVRTSHQKLWLCTWGTMTALVWAGSEEWAEKRVRHQVFNRNASGYDVEKHPVVVTGDVTVRLASPEDLRRFEEAGGGPPPA